MATYGLEQRVYANEASGLEPEMPLESRLGNIANRLAQTIRLLEELQHGPQPEPATNMASPPVAGVLNLGAECDKLSLALENHAMVILKRIGRL